MNSNQNEEEQGLQNPQQVNRNLNKQFSFGLQEFELSNLNKNKKTEVEQLADLDGKKHQSQFIHPDDLDDSVLNVSIKRKGSDARHSKEKSKSRKTHYVEPEFLSPEIRQKYENKREEIDDKIDEDTVLHPQQIQQMQGRAQALKKVKIILKQSDNSATFKCLWYGCFLLIGYGLLIPLMVYHFGAKKERLSSYAGSLGYIVSNLGQSDILDVKLKLTNEICATGYTELNLGQTIPLMRGCYCNDTDTLISGTCTGNSDCMQFDPTQSFNLNIWKDKNFCVKTYSGAQALPTCTSSQKECYSSGCYDQSVDCPITSIKMVSLCKTEIFQDKFYHNCAKLIDAEITKLSCDAATQKACLKTGCYDKTKDCPRTDTSFRTICNPQSFLQNPYNICRSSYDYADSINKIDKTLDYTLSGTTYPSSCKPDEMKCVSTEFAKSEIYNEASFSTVSLDDWNNLTFYKESKKSPVSSIGVSYFGKPCFDIVSYPEESKFYPLIENQPQGCGQSGDDEQSTVLDSSNAFDIYVQNNLTYNLPLFNDSLKELKTVLYKRKKILLNLTQSECRSFKTDHSAKLNEISADLTSFDETVSFWLLTGFFIHSSSVLGGFGVYFYMKSGLAFKRQLFQKRSFQTFYLTLAFVEVVNYVIMCVRMLLKDIDLENNRQIMIDLAGYNCFDNVQATSVLGGYPTLLNDVVGEIFFQVILLIAAQSTVTFCLLMGMFGKKSKKSSDFWTLKAPEKEKQ